MSVAAHVGRPVATGGRGGLSPPLEKFEPPLAGLGCPPWHFIGIGIEVYSPPGILSAPPTNDTWLRRCMSAAHTSPTLSLTLQIGLVKWDPGFTDFDEKINASFICFELGVKTGKLEKKVDRLSLSGVINTLALSFSRRRVPLNNNPKPPIV